MRLDIPGMNIEVLSTVPLSEDGVFAFLGFTCAPCGAQSFDFPVDLDDEAIVSCNECGNVVGPFSQIRARYHLTQRLWKAAKGS